MPVSPTPGNRTFALVINLSATAAASIVEVSAHNNASEFVCPSLVPIQAVPQRPACDLTARRKVQAGKTPTCTPKVNE